MYVKCTILCPFLLFIFFYSSLGQEERLCGDPKCREAISEARLKLKEYTGGTVRISQRDKVFIYSKPKVNDNKGYYEVEVYDKIFSKKKSAGYAPVELLAETKVLVPKKKLVTVLRSKPKASGDSKTEEAATATNTSNVINASPPAQPTAAVAPSAPEVTSTEASTVQYVPGGVMAELGNGGQPATPFEVADGTTFYQGVDGEVTILPTSTDPPSLNTEYPGTKPQIEPDVEPNKTDNAASEDDKESPDEEDGEDEDDDDDDDEGEEEEEEGEEAGSSESDDISKEAAIADAANTPAPQSNAADSSRAKRDIPSNNVPGASGGSMDEISRQIDMASRAEPGLNPDFDEQVLKNMKARVKNEVRPTLPAVADPIMQQATGQQKVEYYPTRTVDPPLETKTDEGSPAQPEAATPHQTSEPSVQSVQEEGSAGLALTALPNEKSEAVKTAPPPQTDNLVTADSMAAADSTTQPSADASPPPDETVTGGLPEGAPEVANELPPSGEVASETTTQNAPEITTESMTEPPVTETPGPVVNESPSTEVPLHTDALNMGPPTDNIDVENKQLASPDSTLTSTPTPNVTTEPPRTEAPLSTLQSDPSLNSALPTNEVLNTDDLPSSDADAVNNTEISQKPGTTLPNIETAENLASDLEGVASDTIPTSYEKDASVPQNEDVRAEKTELPNLPEDTPSLPESTPEIPYQPPDIENATLPTDEQVPFEEDHSRSSENANAETVPDNLPPPSTDQRHMYPGLFHAANVPDVIEEVVSLEEGVGSVEQVTPPPENIAANVPDVIEEAVSLGEGVGSVEQVTPPPENIAEPEVTLPPPQDLPIDDETDSLGYFSGISNFFSNLLGSSAGDVTVEVPPTPVSSQPPPAVDIDGECKNLKDLESDCADAPSPPHLWHVFEKTVPETSYSLLYLIVTAVTLLVFTLGYYFIESSRQNAPLIKKINALTHDLQVATSQLESRPVQESVDNSGILTSIQEELAEVKKRNAALQLQVDGLQNELDSSADAGMELNKMVTDLLAEKQSANALLMSVEHLQGQLDTQQKVIDDMNRSLLEKIEENKALQGELATVQEKSESLEEELTGLRESMGQLIKDKENSAWELEQKFDELEEQNKKLLAEIASLKKAKAAEAETLSGSIAELQKQLALRESEYSALQETVQDLKGSGADASAIYDVGHVKAQLTRVLSEKDMLQERLRDEEGARKLLEDHVKSVDEEVSRLRSAFESAEKEKVEAETKLVVLSNYWKEKETHFHKELGLQEVMWAQKQGEETTAYDRIKSLQDEVESYKSQTEMLKKEIVDQERGLKSQIATLEKKAHENWVAARQAERRLDESKQEAGQLRNMLTLIEKSTTADGNAVASPRVPGELNGDEGPLPPLLPDGTSPLPLPPLPLDPLAGPPPMLPPNFMPGMPPFMPPHMLPPPHLLPGDRRLPPLGRMSSPPLNRFSPGPGDYGYDRMSPTVLSPPARNYRSPPTHRSSPWEEPPHRSGFRPVASHRDSHRDYQGSSSGHSSEESMEKLQPPRRGKV